VDLLAWVGTIGVVVGLLVEEGTVCVRVEPLAWQLHPHDLASHIPDMPFVLLGFRSLNGHRSSHLQLERQLLVA
jgi:hypothetical protein